MAGGPYVYCSGVLKVLPKFSASNYHVSTTNAFLQRDGAWGPYNDGYIFLLSSFYVIIVIKNKIIVLNDHLVINISTTQ